MAGLGTQRKGTRAAIHQECKIKIVDVGNLGLFDFVRNPSVWTTLLNGSWTPDMDPK